MAGHFQQSEDLLVDTHGSDVKDNVWDLLEFTYRHIGVAPTLLERDFNIPPLEDLVTEVARIASLQQHYQSANSQNHVGAAIRT
jgi:uncharacterized protein (UPF0276 family)